MLLVKPFFELLNNFELRFSFLLLKGLLHFTLYIVHFTLNYLHFTLYDLHFTLYYLHIMCTPHPFCCCKYSIIQNQLVYKFRPFNSMHVQRTL